MESKKIKALIKVLFSILLLWFVFRQIDYKEALNTIKSANGYYLFLAFIFFNLSKIVSSVRLNWYFKEIGINLSQKINLILYYIGMFYNLFLPGGIGGDGYKAYLLKKYFSAKLSDILQSLIIDRVSGLIALIFLALILYFFSDFDYFKVLALILALLTYPIFYILNRFYGKFLKYYKQTYLLGLLVQILQVISAYFIVKALPANLPTIDILVLFLISSVVAVLPISIGGVGVREFTFLYGAKLLGFNPSAGVAFSLIFFLITMASSLIGILFIHKEIFDEVKS